MMHTQCVCSCVCPLVIISLEIISFDLKFYWERFPNRSFFVSHKHVNISVHRLELIAFVRRDLHTSRDSK